MRTYSALTCRLMVILAALGITADADALERWDRAVCLLAETADAQGNKTGEFGTAFIVDADGQMVLVTAAHVSKFTNAQSKLLFRSPDGQSRWLLLGALNATEGSPWQTHENSDLAAMRLSVEKADAENRAWLADLAIPMTALAAATPTRTTKIELTGFPLHFGLTPSVSPLVMSATVASCELECEGKWGKERTWFASTVVGDGVSGGPVFETLEDPAAVNLVGMYIGYASDKSGPKLARVVPSRLIREMIEKPLDSE